MTTRTHAAPGGHVVLAPHADDAVWSVGARLARWAAEGRRTTVVTVFSGPADTVFTGPAETVFTGPAAGPAEASGTWRKTADPRVRQAEDAAACAELGAVLVPLGFTDAALRTGAGGSGFLYSAPRRLLGPRHPADARLLEEVRAALAPLCAGPVTVHAPLAAGGHVDHRLVRGAVEALAPGRTVWYEDFPYRLRGRDHAGLRPRTEPLPAGAVERWLSAAGRYAGQARAHFGSVPALREALLARARGHGDGDGHRLADRHWLPAAGGRPARTAEGGRDPRRA
ncbi:PIG-L deacetylase family protein [Streptomyces roseoverticillatus]|uniref:PIG-L deacetylase family protein n=1 Tax=Streptomyces roseoverticillatus TaxID=66429 RepID=UPI0004C0E5BC|nr:PIG-L family deacetylase [Streptomyces roseoverticillatus]